MYKIRLNLTSKHIFLYMTAVILCGTIIRLIPAAETIHYFDLDFYVDWSTGVLNDFFGAYNNIGSLDYPPVFLFPLYPVGKVLLWDIVENIELYKMLALKFWQVLFDIGTIPLLYGVLKKTSPLLGMAAASLWAINPTAIVNSSYWGQTDSIMMFLLVLAFWLLVEQKPEWSGLVMAIACMMKFQSLYFAPVFGLYLLMTYPPKRILRTILTGAATVLAVFTPFMIKSGIMLPFRVYFGGLDKYRNASMNAFNYFAACGLNMKPSDEAVFLSITPDHISKFVTIIALLALVFFMLKAKNKCVWIFCTLFMQTIFMFTTRMHERYQIPVVIFMLIAALSHKSARMFALFIATTFVTFVNHYIVVAGSIILTRTPWMDAFNLIMIVFSIINVLLYIFTVDISLRLLYHDGQFSLREAISDLKQNFQKKEKKQEKFD